MVAAQRAGATVIAAAKDAPPFKLAGDGWTAIQLGVHVKALLGAGPRPTCAVGKQVFALDQVTKLPEAPAPVLALAASPSGVVIACDRGVLRLEGSAWKPVKKAPPSVLRFASDRYAIVPGGVFDLKTGTLVALPDVLAIAAVDATLYAATERELLTIKAGKVTREPIAPPSPIVDLAADRAGRVVIATRDGHLLVRDAGAWTTTAVRDEVPPQHPGPPPATSK